MGQKISLYDPDQAEAERDRALVKIRQRIARDMEKASWRVRDCLKVIHDRLCDLPLGLADVFQGFSGQRGAVSVLFHSEMGLAVGEYITRCRHELSVALLRDTDQRVGDIASFVGFTERTAYSKWFKGLTGLSPEEFRQRWRQAVARAGAPQEDLHDFQLIDQLLRREAEPERLGRALAFVDAVHNGTAGAALESPSPDRIARRLLEMLDRLDASARRRWVRSRIRVDSPALARQLLGRIRSHADDPPRALEFAELAREHVEAQPEALGSETLLLRVLAWVWLAWARHLSHDVVGAEEALATAWAERRATPNDELWVEKHLYNIQAAVHFAQGRYVEACKSMVRVVDLSESVEEPEWSRTLLRLPVRLP